MADTVTCTLCTLTLAHAQAHTHTRTDSCAHTRTCTHMHTHAHARMQERPREDEAATMGHVPAHARRRPPAGSSGSPEASGAWTAPLQGLQVQARPPASGRMTLQLVAPGNSYP